MGSSESCLEFEADLFTLSKEYFDIVMHLRETKLFKERTEKLEKLVEKYLQNYKEFDKTDLNMLAIDTSHKLHPRDYGTAKVDKEYLIKACLRQDEFCRKLHVKCITFEDCEKSYRKFLTVVRKRPKKITVPSMMEDFMWHAHMRDHENYVKDMNRNLGFVLNHDDDIPKKELKQFWDEALGTRNGVYGNKFEEYEIEEVKNKEDTEENVKRIGTKAN